MYILHYFTTHLLKATLLYSTVAILLTNNATSYNEYPLFIKKKNFFYTFKSKFAPIKLEIVNLNFTKPQVRPSN